MVPSDVLSGLILLRQQQQTARQQIVSQVPLVSHISSQLDILPLNFEDNARNSF